MFSAITNQIEVMVRPAYQHEHSKPQEQLYLWTYEVTITNKGAKTVQLLNRYWKIYDANNSVEEVFGPGVIGKKPVLKSGESFQYSSYTRLATPNGRMVGKYEMIDDSGSSFLIDIPEFLLRFPIQRVLRFGSL